MVPETDRSKRIIDSILKNITDFELVILALLKSQNNEPIKNDIFFQKEFFLIMNYIKEMLPGADFIAHTYGPYSEVAEKSMNNLTSYKLADRRKEGYVISRLGEDIFHKLNSKISQEKLDAIDDFKKFLNDLTYDELLVFTYISFPEFTTESGIKEKIYALRKPVSVSLYRKGKISIEKAAFIAGLPLEEYIRYIEKNNENN